MERIRQRDVKLAAMICKAIIANIDCTKKYVYVVSVEMEEEGEFYDLSCNSADFIVTLEKNLQILIEHELYELCGEVAEAIKYLKQKNK
jgi:acyl carrier protein